MALITDFGYDDNEYIEEPSMPMHTMEALDNYFIKGFEPGGFLEAMLAEDYGRALGCADLANAPKFHTIATWLTQWAPKGSTGSHQAVVDWCNDKDGIRSAHREVAEKAYQWRTLGGQKA